jgi:hypothetical protein
MLETPILDYREVRDGEVEWFSKKNWKTIMLVRFPRCYPKLNPAEECRN